MFKILKILIIFFTLSALMVSLLFFSLLWKYSPELPSYSKILQYKPELSSRLYSSDGVLLKSYHQEERIFIPIERIPKKLISAFLSSEDKNFYSHFGIDFVAIIRAAIANIMATFNNQKLIGASTITQQVVKNLLLSNEVSFDRKIKEILLSIRVENILSKNQILELYLNDIYLGFRSYGIAAASLNYFNKSINDLDLSEIAFLASLPKAPNNYNPQKNYAKAFQRRNWVIDRMYDNGFIEYDDLSFKDKPIKLISRDDRSFVGANYFYEEIRKKLFLNYGTETLYSEGLVIKTSLNTKLQQLAEESLVNGLIKYDIKQGWRGVVGNLNEYDVNFEDVIKKIKNPFPKKWFLTKIEKAESNKLFLSSINAENIEIDLKLQPNKWLINKKFKKNDLLFVEKPANLLSVPGKGPAGEYCLSAILQQRYDSLKVVHRLDMATSGLMVFAKNYASQKAINAQFEQRQVDKSYIAVVDGKIDESGSIDLPLMTDWPNRPKQKVCHQQGRKSLTYYQPITYNKENNSTRLLLQPKTGRSHQLRVHMMAIGHAILGDEFYADASTFEKSARLLLHAQSLTLSHPVTGQELSISSEVPF